MSTIGSNTTYRIAVSNISDQIVLSLKYCVHDKINLKKIEDGKT